MTLTVRSAETSGLEKADPLRTRGERLEADVEGEAREQQQRYGQQHPADHREGTFLPREEPVQRVDGYSETERRGPLVGRAERTADRTEEQHRVEGPECSEEDRSDEEYPFGDRNVHPPMVRTLMRHEVF